MSGPVAAVLIFVVLPIILTLLSFRIRPMKDASGDTLGAGLVARGVFGGHGLAPDERVVAEVEGRPFLLGEKER